MNKFYNFKNEADTTELYLYGAITSDKWYEDEVSAADFRNALDEIKDNGILNIYINSPGGEVFVTDAIISMLSRCKEKKNITIKAYIDGLGASCASWLPMVADEIFIYQQSMLMLHKPMSCVWGNSNDMQKQIEILDKLEDTMVQMYLAKAKEDVTKDQIKEMLDKETWLNAEEIQAIFNVTYVENSNKVVACVDKDMFNKYKNVPKDLLENAKETIENNTEDEEKQKRREEEINNKMKEIDVMLALL